VPVAAGRFIEGVLLSILNNNLYAIYERHFPSGREKTCLETEAGYCYSYRALEEETARYAAALASLGVRKGDRVLVQVEKSPQAFFLYFGCIRAGAIYLPLNPAYRKHEMEYILSDAEPAVVVCREQSETEWKELAAARPLGSLVPQVETLDDSGGGSISEKAREHDGHFSTMACEPRDIAAIVYTSGTTGRPKGAMITHLNLSSNGQALHDFWRWRPTDVLIHAVPLFHVHGLFVACGCALMCGAKMIFLAKYEVRTVMRNLPRATVMMGVPTYYTRLLEQPDFTRETCRNMRLFISGSAPLLEQTFRDFEARTGFRLVDRYGMTETEANCSLPVEGGERIPGSVGVPLPGVTIRLVGEDGKEVRQGEVGEIEIKGDNVFAGYWRKPDETAASFTADGFFKSGDLGRIAPNGYLSIVGRSKDLIISGGLNVYPKEIESTIDEMQGVVESAVIGVPHPDFGEAVIAVVVKDSGANDLTEEKIIAELKKELANFKVPKRVFFASEIPRNTMGKVQKNLLRTNAEYASLFAAK